MTKHFFPSLFSRQTAGVKTDGRVCGVGIVLQDGQEIATMYRG
jgi:hypothetical protein